MRGLGKLGSLEVRLADAADRQAALRLRQNVFGRAREGDAFDEACDHLVVLDRTLPVETRVVATYRLLPQVRVGAGLGVDGFYTAGEFEIERLIERHAGLRFLELGRSCVAPTHRTKRVMELLWHGTWAYVLAGGFDVLMGCASFPGTDPERHAQPLAFLRANARAEADWRVSAVAGGMPLPDATFDPRTAMRALPPLVRGYLRLGAEIGEDAVVDADFGTTDVLVLLRRERISQRYIDHYGADASRYAA